MTYSPVINARKMADNLLAYFQSEQVTALEYVIGTSPSGYRTFQSIANSIADRSTPLYPALQFSSDSDAVDYTGDVLQGAYSVTFDVYVNHQDPNSAVTQARNYSTAINLMIRNIPLATLIAGTGVYHAQLDTLETAFDPMKTNEKQNDFMQQFQVRITYILMASAN